MIRLRRYIDSKLSAYFVLIICVLFCYDLYICKYTLFQDDYGFITSAYEYKTFTNLIDYLINTFTTWPQGRPLGFAFPIFVSWFIGHSGQLWIAYTLCSIIIIVNSLLIYNILFKITNRFNALLGAIVYITFPADATKLFLTHGLQIQPGIMCSLVGILVYQRLCDAPHVKKHLLFISYIFSFFSLLFYETTFLPFILAVPLSKKWKTKAFYISHICCIILTLIIYVFIRHLLNESRLDSLVIDSTLFVGLINNIYYGTLATFYSYIIAIRNIYNILNIWFVVGVAFLIILIFSWYIHNNKICKNFDKIRMYILLIMIPSGYLFSISHDTFVFKHITTSVHIAESAIFCFPCAYALCLNNKLCNFIIITLISIGITNSIAVEYNYAKMSDIQKQYIVQLVNYINNNGYDDNSVIIVIIDKEIQDIPEVKYSFMQPFTWGNSYSFEHIIGKNHQGHNNARMISPIWNTNNIKYSDSTITVFNDSYPDWGKFIDINKRNAMIIKYTKEGIINDNKLNHNISHISSPLPLNEKYIKFVYGDEMIKLIKGTF